MTQPADGARRLIEPVCTLPQWKPPAAATRSEISGARASVLAEVSGYACTLEAGSQAPPPAPLRLGEIVGERYVIEQHISGGGFGAVYRASDRQIRHHQVALKLLHAPAKDEQARETALRELTLIASVSHPSVVQFKDYGWHAGRLWFAMPWHRGETLDKRYTDAAGPRPMSRAVARKIFERIAQGLAAMHAVGIYHHDIKPENVFVADIAGFSGGLPVLLDLGIASKRGETPKGLTVEYAAPETAAAALGNREQTVGAAADVFSLALVLRNLLEPESAPSTRGELMALLHRRATEPIPQLQRRELRYLRPAFARWLNLDPAQRPSAAELAQELSLLTEPEERREARLRVLRRVVPILAVAGALVAVLLLQVRKQKTLLTAERQRLSQQIQQSAELRKQSTDQLQQLEQKSQQIGSQSQQLQRAIAIARRIDAQLTKAEERGDSLARKLRKVSDERDAFGAERDALSRQRDELSATRDRLLAERQELTQQRDALSAERDGLVHQRDELVRKGEALEQDRNAMLAQRNDLARQRDRIEAELGSTQKQLELQRAERAELRAAYDALKGEVGVLRGQMRDLRAAPRPQALPAPAPVPERAPAGAVGLSPAAAGGAGPGRASP